MSNLTISFDKRFCNTADDYIMEIESCVEQIKYISAIIGNTYVKPSEGNVQIGSLSTTVGILCDYCDGIIQDYYSKKIE